MWVLPTDWNTKLLENERFWNSIGQCLINVNIVIFYFVDCQIAEYDFIFMNRVKNINILKNREMTVNFIFHKILATAFSQTCIFIVCGFINSNIEWKQFVCTDELGEIYCKKYYYQPIIYINLLYHVAKLFAYYIWFLYL